MLEVSQVVPELDQHLLRVTVGVHDREVAHEAALEAALNILLKPVLSTCTVHCTEYSTSVQG